MSILGVDFRMKTVDIDGKKITLEIWYANIMIANLILQRFLWTGSVFYAIIFSLKLSKLA